MTAYISLFVIINLTLLTNYIPNRKVGRVMAVGIPLTLLFFLMILRDYSVGNDIIVYKSQFDSYLSTSHFTAKKDFGFYFLLFAFAKTFHNFRFFLAFEYLIFYIALAMFLYFFSKNVQVALLVFLFSPLFELSVSGLRQTFGIALCLFSIIFFVRLRKPINYIVSLLFWLTSCTMHTCLIPFALFFVFYNFAAKLKFVWLYVFLFLLCAISSKYIFYILDGLADLGYGASGVFLGAPKVAMVYFFFFLVVLCLIDLPVLNKKFSNFYSYDEEEKNEISKFLLLFLIYILFQSTVTYNLIFARFGTVFSIFFPLIFSNVFDLVNKRKARTVLYIAVVALAAIAFWYENIHHDACGVYPYIFGSF